MSGFDIDKVTKLVNNVLDSDSYMVGDGIRYLRLQLLELGSLNETLLEQLDASTAGYGNELDDELCERLAIMAANTKTIIERMQTAKKALEHYDRVFD